MEYLIVGFVVISLLAFLVVLRVYLPINSKSGRKAKPSQNVPPFDDRQEVYILQLENEIESLRELRKKDGETINRLMMQIDSLKKWQT